MGLISTLLLKVSSLACFFFQANVTSHKEAFCLAV